MYSIVFLGTINIWQDITCIYNICNLHSILYTLYQHFVPLCCLFYDDIFCIIACILRIAFVGCTLLYITTHTIHYIIHHIVYLNYKFQVQYMNACGPKQNAYLFTHPREKTMPKVFQLIRHFTAVSTAVDGCGKVWCVPKTLKQATPEMTFPNRTPKFRQRVWSSARVEIQTIRPAWYPCFIPGLSHRMKSEPSLVPRHPNGAILQLRPSGWSTSSKTGLSRRLSILWTESCTERAAGGRGAFPLWLGIINLW